MFEVRIDKLEMVNRANAMSIIVDMLSFLVHLYKAYSLMIQVIEMDRYVRLVLEINGQIGELVGMNHLR